MSSTATPASSASPSSSAVTQAQLWSSSTFKYGILILFVAIFVSSLLCSMLVRRRAVSAMRWHTMQFEEHVRQTRKIPETPPKMSEVYLERRSCVGIDSVPLSSTTMSTTRQPIVSTPVAPAQRTNRFPRLGRSTHSDTSSAALPMQAPINTPLEDVQVVVMIAMPSQYPGVGKEVSDDDLDEMGITEKIGGAVEIGVAAFRVTERQSAPSSGI